MIDPRLMTLDGLLRVLGVFVGVCGGLGGVSVGGGVSGVDIFRWFTFE